MLGVYWDVLHSCEFCIQDSQGPISEVKRLAALHMAVDLLLSPILSQINQSCMLKALQSTNCDSTINLWRKVWALTFWGVVTKPISMAGKTQRQNSIGKAFFGMVVVDRGRIFLKSHRLCHDLTNSLSFFLSYYSENVITFMIFLTTWMAIIKIMPKFCWFWRK